MYGSTTTATTCLPARLKALSCAPLSTSASGLSGEWRLATLCADCRSTGLASDPANRWGAGGGGRRGVTGGGRDLGSDLRKDAAQEGGAKAAAEQHRCGAECGGRAGPDPRLNALMTTIEQFQTYGAGIQRVETARWLCWFLAVGMG